MTKIFLILIIYISFFPLSVVDAKETSCINCHSNKELFTEDGLENIVSDFENDVHKKAGISCHNCHGGNPDPKLSRKMIKAMSDDYEINPFLGEVNIKDIPSLCGKCHSDPLYMKQFQAKARIDQETLYRTSKHGIALMKGNKNSAVCTSCHGIHNIRKISDSGSAVYPTKVAYTCSKCHSDPEVMQGAKFSNNKSIPTNQFENWSQSVHGEALMKNADIYAPTCNDCHGNHDSISFDINSITNICGQCHSRESKLFRNSPKYKKIESHNSYMIPKGKNKKTCKDCHSHIGADSNNNIGACSECHGSHYIIRPSMAMLFQMLPAPCLFCHKGPNEPMDELAESKEKRAHFSEELELLLNEAAKLMLEDDDLYDWMVDRAKKFHHHIEKDPEAENGFRLRREFDNLFKKFRIGKVQFRSKMSSDGQLQKYRVTRCTDCHEIRSQALTVSESFLYKMRKLTVTIARAERILLSARRSGVEIINGAKELSKAVNSQIELEVLLHTFSIDKNGPFAKKHKLGMSYATNAFKIGLSALQEVKKRWIWVSLCQVVTLLVIVGLSFKIKHSHEN